MISSGLYATSQIGCADDLLEDPPRLMDCTQRSLLWLWAKASVVSFKRSADESKLKLKQFQDAVKLLNDIFGEQADIQKLWRTAKAAKACCWFC